MSITDSTYYGFTKIREMSPEAQDWATVDTNWELVSQILKSLEQHQHTGATALAYPGYNVGSPTNPTFATLAELATGGVLTPGIDIGVRLAFVTSGGLETDGSPEEVITLAPAVQSPLAPTFTSTTITANAVPGGSYIYVITKVKGSGETEPSDVLPVDVPYDNTYTVTIGFDPISTYAGTVTGTTTNLSPIITSTVTTNLSPGMSITGAGIPANTYIDTVDSGTQITLTKNATASAGSVTLTYADGTTSLKIYRSAGLDSSFTLLTEITNTATTSFNDINSIPTANVDVQPPSGSTFDGSRSITIDWSAITGALNASRPATASLLRVYITQEAYLWGTDTLLSEIDLTTDTTTSLTYTGKETLSSGWPKDTSQIPAAASKINLATQSTGFPTIAADVDFVGFQAKNMIVHKGASAPSPLTDGMLWYDTGANNVKARINGAWTNWGVTAGTAYTHPNEETGGHLATNIRWITTVASPNVNTLLSTFFNAFGARIQVLNVSRGTIVAVGDTLSSTGMHVINNLTLSPLVADFNNQWCELTLDLQLVWSIGTNPTINIEIQQDQGSLTWTTITVTSERSYSLSSTKTYEVVSIRDYFQMPTSGSSYRFRVRGSVSTGTTILGPGHFTAVKVF